MASEVFSQSIEEAGRNNTGGYASIEAAINPKATVAAGIRGDYVTSHNRGGYFGDYETSNGALSGSGSLTVGPWAGVSFVAQAGSGFRDPTVSDRYYRGPTGRGYITGNPELKPERSVQFDSGMRYTASRVRLGLFGFQYNITDLVERYQTSPDNFTFRNRGEARIRGLELEVQAQLAWQLSLESTATVTSGIALDDDAALDDMPPATFTLGLRRSVTSRGFVQVRGAFYSTDDDPGPTRYACRVHHRGCGRRGHAGHVDRSQPQRSEPARPRLPGEHRPSRRVGARPERGPHREPAILTAGVAGTPPACVLYSTSACLALFTLCRSGETGRRAGLKIPWGLPPVWVRFPPPAPTLEGLSVIHPSPRKASIRPIAAVSWLWPG